MTESVFERGRRIRDANLTMAETFYLLTISEFLGKNGHAWPSQSTLANAMNATRRAVQKWQSALESAGVIEVESGSGCRNSNRYRLNLDRLTPKAKSCSALNSEHSAPLTEDNGAPCSLFPESNSEPRALGIANQVRLNGEPRAHKRTKKDHRKEQLRNSGNSRFVPSGKSAEAPTPETDSKLITFCTEWNSWHSAGIVRQKIRDTNLPGKTIEAAWKKAQRDPEQRERLRNVSALRDAISRSQVFLKDARWFDAGSLIGGKNSNRRWYAEQLISGAYFDKSNIRGNTEHSAEALQAWQKTLDAIRKHSSYRSAEIQQAIGDRAWRAIKRIGVKRVEDSTDFERRELESRFLDAFTTGATT